MPVESVWQQHAKMLPPHSQGTHLGRRSNGPDEAVRISNIERWTLGFNFLSKFSKNPWPKRPYTVGIIKKQEL